ncbi:hypothetical protein [Bythopirellula polymerisocia]|uniref:Phytase-like domain-containing protein n=1 Tax=Bythopirellula polymerisocia TaxID=2528003 RepID=A0A5C6CRA3_9BACT|nr:hypothetical protein [Bythopirellula polymerisocia]TWU25971.1 hypothetical protein Pla144_31850 [Bythopirellula polymerisocia]
MIFAPHCLRNAIFAQDRFQRSLLSCILWIFSASFCTAQDQFNFYFSGSTAGVGDIGSYTFDAAGDFWVIGRSPIVSQTPAPRISKLSNNGSSWSADPHVLDEDFAFFYRSVDLASGIADASLGGPALGTPASFLLNPAPLTLTIPTGSGGTMQRIYQPGELAFVSDAMGVIAEQNGTPILSATKKIFRYDLRKVHNPDFGVDGTTTQQPDYANATITNGVNTIQFGASGVTDFNDAFAVVMSEQDMQDAVAASLTADFNKNKVVEGLDLQIWQANYGSAATGTTGDTDADGDADGRDFLTWQRQLGLKDGGSDNFGRSFAWSSDGQSIYAVDAGSNTGGIYRIDATQQVAARRIWIDTKSDDFSSRINSEPAVIHTSARDFDPANPAVGDQIIVEGSLTGGNEGGVNVYLDTGALTVTDPLHLFSEADFRGFAEYIGDSSPQYLSLTTDQVGNLYFHEIQTDGVFVYDTQGRFAKIASEAEHNEFQLANGVGVNDTVLDLQVRTSNIPGFTVNEVIYTDDTLDAPVGILAYKTGDFDRDNDLDASDFALFASALGTRGAPAALENYKFDLNGNAVLAFDTEDQRFEHVSNGPVVVDWKDVKILQQFADIKNGDANFDGAVDFLDLDIMSLNYYTISGQTAETWIDGDFASIDPDYFLDASDVNLVNRVDLDVIADTWVNLLGQSPVTVMDANSHGYVGQFRIDLLSAFADISALSADFNDDMFVDGVDLQIWQSNFGNPGNGLTGDADGDGDVDGRDFLLWERQFTGNAPLVTASQSTVPEQSCFCLSLLVLLGCISLRRL